jgi:gliding motility-associated-like protein
VLKLAKCTNITTANLTISSCNSYTLNNHTYDTSGIYLQTIPNYSGCDSIITLNITINKKFTDQIKVICQGEFFYAGGANQTTAGIYKDTLQTSLGCDSVITTHLTVYPKPLPNLGPDKNLCKNTQLTITPGVFTSYLWQNMSTQSTFTIDTPGLYWATVTNSDNCPATDSIRINTILQPPENFLKAVDSICAYEKLLLQPLSNFSSYLWSTGSTQKSFTIETPGQYWLRVSDANGCYGNDTTTIALKDCITNVFIPTAFTPNNDGKNDFFGATVPANIQSFKLQVFDRAGLLIFQTTNPAKKWDGVYKGVAYSTAMFVWQCFYQLKNEAPGYQKGTIILIK